MGDKATTSEVSASTSSTMDRRRMLQVGTAGVVAVGAVAAGAPQVLGLSSSPLYAAAASGPGDSVTLPPDSSTITGQVNLRVNGDQYVLLATYTGITAHLYSAAAGGTELAATTVSAQDTTNFIAFAFFRLHAGTYWLDFDEAISGLLAQLPGFTQFTPNPTPRIKFVLTTVSTNPGHTVATTLLA